MNPAAMITLFVAAVAAFIYSAHRRWRLLRVGRPENRIDRLPRRIGAVVRYALRQRKMYYYPAAAIGHHLIFFGFVVLLLRSIVLWGRGISPSFNLWLLGPEPVALPLFGSVPLGAIYEFLKDTFASLVLIGVGVFVYYRVIKPQKRMSLHPEGLVILGIIAVMMIADLTYDGASLVLHQRWGTLGCSPAGAAGAPDYCERVATVLAPLGVPPAGHEALAWRFWPNPAGSLMATALVGVGTSALVFLAQAGFWVHSSLVLIFLNILPYTKHFHIITAVPNVFATSLDAPGRMHPLAPSSEKLMEAVGAAAEKADPLAAPIGVARIEHFTWKAILDFYTCTECGRCSDNCPAYRTGKILSPKELTLDLRNFAYDHESELMATFENGERRERASSEGPAAQPDGAQGADGEGAAASGAEGAGADGAPAFAAEGAGADGAPAFAAGTGSAPYRPVDLVPHVIHPDVLWACTTCRACEEQCPVMISYVDKITDMRRNLVLVRGEFPNELQKPFQGMEVNGNPWNLARVDRAGWADGLDVKVMSEHPKAEVLFWVGCSASYDDRAKKIARATAKLLARAGVDFAILGQEETCTGDPARRAGNEYLFMMLAEQNVATLNGYREQGGARTIVTTCPHCFNTLLNEYPDLGGKYEVVHHTDFLLGLVASKKLVPGKPVEGKVVFHDSCYLGRYNGIYDSPREILQRIPGVTLVEASMSRSTGLCCGAGGAQMWMEEQNKDRMNVRRTLQLLQTEAKTIASACPFCMTMLTDGLKAKSLEGEVRQLDVAELLAESCGVDELAQTRGARDMEQEPAAQAG